MSREPGSKYNIKTSIYYTLNNNLLYSLNQLNKKKRP